MARVKLGFSRFSVAVKILKSRMIVQSMAGNPIFANIPPEIALAIITAAIDDLEQKAQAAIKGGTDKTLAMYISENQLTVLMGKLLDYVQVASNGDPLIIESSGMEVRRERVPSTLLPAIENPKAKVGLNQGEINVSWEGMPGAKGYVVEMKLPQETGPINSPTDPIPTGGGTDVMTDPTTTVAWVRIDTVTKTRLVVKNLTTGTVYSFRIAAFNTAGQGAYSQTVSSVTP